MNDEGSIINKIPVNGSLLFVPFFPDKELESSLRPVKTLRRFQGVIRLFPTFTLISGFIGYPHLYLLLAFLEDIPPRNIYFLGTAGAIHPRFRDPQILQISEISGYAALRSLSRKNYLSMHVIPDSPYPHVRGVSIDIIQRENANFLARQKKNRTEIVEMEIFPLRAYLKVPFTALVVLTDRVDRIGIHPFQDRKKIKNCFSDAFQFIWENIHAR